jgi:beta-N-acetylhexosaminidase
VTSSERGPVTSSDVERLVDSLLFPGFVGTSAPEWVLRRVADGLGGVVLFARNIGADTGLTALTALTAELHETRPGVLVAVDEEGGDVTRLEARLGSRHLGHLALGHVDDLALTRATGASIGTLLADHGIDWNWAPVADVDSIADSPVVGVRSFGGDPRVVGRHAAAFVSGLQDDAGIIACAKHFPGHGDTTVDSHRGLPTIESSREQLDLGALVPFRACIDAGVRSIMTGHLRVLALDPSAPATLSRDVVTGLLREELHYDGLVVSDALEMAAVADFCGIGDGAVRALLAGVDALCLGGHLADEGVVDLVRSAVLSALRTGRLPESRLLDAARRVAELSRWRQEQVARARPERARPSVASVASRCLAVDGDVRLPEGDPVVLRCVPEPMIAAGAAAPNVSELLARIRPGTDDVALAGARPLAAALAAARQRPLVLVLRDSTRHDWQRAIEREVVLRRPDVVVIDTGVPSVAADAHVARITTFGLSRVSALAAVAALTGTTLEETP